MTGVYLNFTSHSVGGERAGNFEVSRAARLGITQLREPQGGRKSGGGWKRGAGGGRRGEKEISKRDSRNDDADPKKKHKDMGRGNPKVTVDIQENETGARGPASW